MSDFILVRRKEKSFKRCRDVLNKNDVGKVKFENDRRRNLFKWISTDLTSLLCKYEKKRRGGRSLLIKMIN